MQVLPDSATTDSVLTAGATGVGGWGVNNVPGTGSAYVNVVDDSFRTYAVTGTLDIRAARPLRAHLDIVASGPGMVSTRQIVADVTFSYHRDRITCD